MPPAGTPHLDIQDFVSVAAGEYLSLPQRRAAAPIALRRCIEVPRAAFQKKTRREAHPASTRKISYTATGERWTRAEEPRSGGDSSETMYRHPASGFLGTSIAIMVQLGAAGKSDLEFLNWF
ncbi:hypothetical protein C8R46DRAFT_1024609 [Mycena filopes]|nr:hypothetical protein C8R46DRAFT_1024609 [Mycena filopes]